MSGTAAKIRSAGAALALLATLGFGASQALAAPPAEAANAQCNPTACNASCEGRFGPFASGFCEDGQCFCAI